MLRSLFRHGFTLAELAVVIGITVIIVATIIPLYQFIQTYSALASSKTEIAQHIRLAETLARSDKGGSAYGIKFEPHEYTLYKGSSYAMRSVADDRVFTIPANITLSGITDMVFTQHSGFPSAPGTLTIMHAQSNKSETITINAIGLIE